MVADQEMNGPEWESWRQQECELCPTSTKTQKVINGSLNCFALHRFIKESGMLMLSLFTSTDSNPLLMSSHREETKDSI